MSSNPRLQVSPAEINTLKLGDNKFSITRRMSENADFLQNKEKFSEKSQFTGVNEHFKPNFNAVLEERCIFGQPPRRLSENSGFRQIKASNCRKSAVYVCK